MFLYGLLQGFGIGPYGGLKNEAGVWGHRLI